MAELTAELQVATATYDTLKNEGWTKTEIAPTRKDIHTELQKTLGLKPYYWQHVDRKKGPQWLCSTDLDELVGWMEQARAVTVEDLEKLGLPFQEDPTVAVANVWIAVTKMIKARLQDIKVQ